MVLAGDLTDRVGRLLMPRGTILTEKYLRICKMWGIVEADIEGVSSDDINAEAIKHFDAEVIAAASEVVHKRFCHTDLYHPAIREMINLCVLRQADGKKVDRDNFKECHWPEERMEELGKISLNIDPKRFIGNHTNLSTLPDIYAQIIEAIAKPSSSAYDIENVMSKDTNLSAKLLRLVNSAFYGYPHRIDTISRAVNIVGTKQLSMLAMGVTVIEMFGNIPPEIVNMKMFWKHSILCGIVARILASYRNIQNTERMFVAGLLHDIGRLLFYNHMPKESLLVVAAARKRGLLLTQVEHDIFGHDHAAIGGELLAKWKIPMSLEDAVYHHHNPLRSRSRVEASVLHLADIVANAMGEGTSGERLVPPLNQEVWMQLAFSPNILPSVMEQADRQLENVFEMMFSYES